MNKVNRGTNAGGSRTNLNGINFEENIYLYEWIKKAGYILEDVKISTNRSAYYSIIDKSSKNVLGYYGRQGQIYNALKKLYPEKINNNYIKEVLSKKINPDAFILRINKPTLSIFEKKWQQSSGSVDEKIQTGPFKVEMFEKLVGKIKDLEVNYQYILSPWFKDKQYRNTKEYYKNNNKINIWVQDENLDDLNINDFIKP